MKKLCVSKIICLFLFVSVIMSGCSFSQLDKQSKNLTNYDINLVFNDSDYSFIGNQNVDYINSTDIVLENIDFHLYANAFKNKETKQKVVSDFNYEKAYPNGFDSGYIDIESVKVSGEKADFNLCENENTIISVKLKKKLYPTERVKIEFNYKLKIPNIHHRFGYGENTINVGNFYPIACVYEGGGFVHDGYHYNGDPFYSEMANYEVKITYSNQYKIGATGECISTDKIENKICKKYKAKVVRDFAFVLSDKFLEKQSKFESTSINYLYYKDDNASETIKLIKDILKTFNNLIGEYPYSTLTVVQSNFIHGGMEFPNIVLISDDIEIKSDYNNVIIHEIAHQWFYNIIGNNEVSEAWLDEGLTEYVTAMFYDINKDYGTTCKEVVNNMLNSYLLFVDIYEDVFGELDTSMNRKLEEFGSEYEYTYMVYVKAVLMLDNIREVMGDAKFCLGLKTYFENNKFKIATKAHFIRDFNKASNTDIKGIVNSWVEGKVKIKN